MDDRNSRINERSTKTVLVPPEHGEVMLRDQGSSNEDETWLEHVMFFVVSLGPRFFELLSIVLLSSGINVLTALLDARSERLTRLISAASFILAGGLLFFFSSHVERSYDDAKAQQRKQVEKKDPITPIAILAADNLSFAKKKLKWKFLTLTFAVVLFVVGLGTLVYGWAQKSIETQANQPSITSPSTQTPSETGATNPSGTPNSNESNSNNNSSKKIGEKENKRAGKR